MRTRLLPALVLSTVALPGAAQATCAGARSNLAFIHQSIGALRGDPSASARQEAARWAAVLPRAQQDVATECAASGSAQQRPPIAPPRLDPPRLDPPRAADVPPMIAVPTTTRATPTQAAPPPPDPITTASTPPATPASTESHASAKLDPAQGVATSALTLSHDAALFQTPAGTPVRKVTNKTNASANKSKKKAATAKQTAAQSTR
jgi:hypothetical protein